MLWMTHPDFRSYTGNWQDGTIEGFGELRSAWFLYPRHLLIRTTANEMHF